MYWTNCKEHRWQDKMYTIGVICNTKFFKGALLVKQLCKLHPYFVRINALMGQYRHDQQGMESEC